MCLPRTFRWLGLVCVLALLVAGCAPKGTPVNADNRTPIPAPTPPRDRAELPAFYLHAVDLRVHPATRYVREAGELRLETRVELLDQFNEPIKDVGELVVELRTLDDDGRLVVEGADRRDHRWSFDISTREAQLSYWDPIARSYILPLKIDARDHDLPEKRTVLLVTFQPAWPGADVVPRSEDRRKPVEIRRVW